MSNSEQTKKIANVIIGLERTALGRWYKGDPNGYLEIYDEEDMTYLDPSSYKRLDDFASVKAFYGSIKGLVHAEKHEILNPLVQVLTDSSAVLSYNLAAYVGEDIHKWNLSSVFKLNKNNQWKIVHTNWSFTRPMDISFDKNKDIV